MAKPMLNDAHERFDFDTPVPVVMAPLTGAPVTLAVVRVDVDGGEVIVSGALTAADFASAAQRGCFHLDDEEPSPGWSPSAPVDVVLRLRRPVARAFDDADALVAALLGAAPTPLRATEAWFALEAMQSVAVPGEPDVTTSFGLRTRWADAPR